MREYKCVEIKKEMKDTERMLNEDAQNNWRLICSYAYQGRYLILEREVNK